MVTYTKKSSGGTLKDFSTRSSTQQLEPEEQQMEKEIKNTGDYAGGNSVAISWKLLSFE